ncbi:major antigen-like isoform X2 [Salvia hispanica]|uniref:major antigen-like isoform X2 n=1 Tax=Salvia hispanica TaxID=49212 RepID=UPI00200963E7|nr:major antigen-like isoform X2 [Salvia hispanica]
MPRQSLINVNVKIGRRKCKVRKRGCSSSSSSSLVQNNWLKRAFLVGKRLGSSTTHVPRWKMMTSKSPSLNYVATTGDEKARELSISARKLAATLWEIDGFPSPRVERENLDDRRSEVGGVVRMLESGSTALVLSDPFRSPLTERMEPHPPKMASHRRRASASSQKLDSTNCLLEVDQAQNHARSPYRHVVGTKNRLKDVYNGLITSKELLKVMSRVSHLDEQNSTRLSLFSALKFELDRACIHVSKLIQEQRKGGEIGVLVKQLEEEKLVWKLKEQDRIRSAIASVNGELETERKMRRQTERLNKKLGVELAETRESLTKMSKELESEKRAREIFEQVCDELARGIGEDQAEVEELKRRSAKVCKEVEKEREMLQLADVLREERVQMKLAEAKYQFEEKNALVDTLRSELEAYLKSKNSKEQQGDGSPSYDKIKELERYLRETLPSPYEYQDKNRDGILDVSALNKDNQHEEEAEDSDDDDDEQEEEEEDSADSDLHSIELNMDDISQSFQWGDAAKAESKRRKSISRKIKKPPSPVAEAAILSDGNKQETLDMFDRRGLFEFSSMPWKKKEIKDELERYNMIKDLRDHIVSTSRIASSQDLATPSKEDPPNGGVTVPCHG